MSLLPATALDSGTPASRNPLRQLVLQFQQQAFGGFLADAGNLGQAPDVLRDYRLGQLGHRHAAEDGQRQLGADAGDLEQTGGKSARSSSVAKPYSRCASSRTISWVCSVTLSPSAGRL